MKEMNVTMTETISVPDDAEVHYAATGVAAGIKLADGRIIKTWISYEIEEIDGSARDLSQDELQALDIDVDLDYSREIVEG